MMSINAQSVKHIPQRTCVACREIKAKQELVRLVRIDDGSVKVDTGGKKPGRGAYLCRTQECWKTGVKSGRLEYTLRTSLTPDNREQLVKYGESLFEE